MFLHPHITETTYYHVDHTKNWDVQPMVQMNMIQYERIFHKHLKYLKHLRLGSWAR